MSKHRIISLTCPKCGSRHPFQLWDSVNTMIDPQLKAAVLDRSLFRFQCPTCGNGTVVQSDFLYHQMEDRIMIQLAFSDKAAEDCYAMFTNTSDIAVRQLREQNYLFRIVRSYNELLEKILIFDRGLDDRVIELVKDPMMAFTLLSHPELKGADFLFYAEGDEMMFKVVGEDGPIGSIGLPQKLYDGVKRDFSHKLTDDMRKADPIINLEWARKTTGRDR